MQENIPNVSYEVKDPEVQSIYEIVKKELVRQGFGEKLRVYLRKGLKNQPKYYFYAPLLAAANVIFFLIGIVFLFKKALLGLIFLIAAVIWAKILSKISKSKEILEAEARAVEEEGSYRLLSIVARELSNGLPPKDIAEVVKAEIDRTLERQKKVRFEGKYG